MYRCMACDAPSQQKCKCSDQINKDFEQAMAALKDDPWGWQDEPFKLDIQSGTYVEAQAYA